MAQRYVAEYSNGQAALPALLEQLEVAGCIVSIDAMSCQPKIAKQSKEQDGEYMLALKVNLRNTLAGRRRPVGFRALDRGC